MNLDDSGGAIDVSPFISSANSVQSFFLLSFFFYLLSFVFYLHPAAISDHLMLLGVLDLSWMVQCSGALQCRIN